MLLLIQDLDIRIRRRHRRAAPRPHPRLPAHRSTQGPHPQGSIPGPRKQRPRTLMQVRGHSYVLRHHMVGVTGFNLRPLRPRIRPWKPVNITKDAGQSLGLHWSGMVLRGRKVKIISRISPETGHPTRKLSVVRVDWSWHCSLIRIRIRAHNLARERVRVPKPLGWSLITATEGGAAVVLGPVRRRALWQRHRPRE